MNIKQYLPTTTPLRVPGRPETEDYNMVTGVDHGLVIFTAIMMAMLNIVMFAYCAVSGAHMMWAVLAAVSFDITLVRLLTKRGFFYKHADWRKPGAEDQNGAVEPEDVIFAHVPWRPLAIGFLVLCLAYAAAYALGADLPTWSF